MGLAVYSFSSSAQLNLILDYASFYHEDSGPYLEVYLNVNGRSLQYQANDSGKIQASIELTYLIEKEDSIIAYEKFQLNSPQYETTENILDMRDLHRLPIKNGKFKFTLIAKDLVSGELVESSQELREVLYKPSVVNFSGVQLANKVTASSINGPFVKNGFDIEPNLAHYFGANQQALYFYTELYFSDQIGGNNEPFLLAYSIVDAKTKKLMANLSGFKRLNGKNIHPVLQSFDLKNLPSGKYALLLQAKNKNNEVVCEQSVEFYQSNPGLVNFSAINSLNTFVDSMTNKAQLAEYIRSLDPISNANEKAFAQNQLKHADLEFMQQYFLNFWKSRNPEEPYVSWLAYQAELEKVDQLFAYGKTPGYRTERGRIYLQYGEPNSMQNVPYEPNTFPYSVWHYNKINGISNRKFIFFSPSMEVLGYEVLHSNVPGEIQNPNWELQLMSKSNAGIRPTQETPENTMINRRARDLWENPR